MMRVVETGRNPTMRYIGRTHGVSIAWLHERFKEQHHLMTYCESSKQAGDIYTKPFIDAAKWESVYNLIGVCHPSLLHAVIHDFVATYGKLNLKPKPSADSEEDLAAPAVSECRASGDGGRSLSPAAAAGSKSSSLAVWSGSDSDVHGKPRQTFLDKLRGPG